MPLTTRRPLRWTGIPIALALAFATLIAPGMTAAQAAEAQLTISVYDDWDNSVDGAQIQVFDQDPEDEPAAAPVSTGVATGGSLSVTLPEEGEYWVSATRDGYLPAVRYVGVWGSDAWLSIYLESDPAFLGTLTGQILDENGAGLNDIHVDFVRLDGDDEQAGSTGTFSASLQPGRYRLALDDHDETYPYQWIGGTSFSTATTFTVTARQTTTVPATRILPGPAVTGTVTDAAGKPIRNIQVELHHRDDPWDAVNGAQTGRAGTFRIGNIAPGEYKLLFRDGNGDYVTEWNGDALEWDDAPLLTIDRDLTVNASLAATPPGEASPFVVQGTVRDTSGAPVRGSRVNLLRVGSDPTDLNWWDETSTDLSGRYTFSDVPAGKYTVYVQSDGEYDGRFLGNAYLPRGAATFTVLEQGTVTAPAVTVERYASLSGRVSLPAGLSSGDVERYVELYNADEERVEDYEPGRNGTYLFDRVRPGTYTVRVRGWSYSDGMGTELVSQFWRNAYSFATATRIRVTADGEVKNIDVALGDQLANVARPTLVGSGALGTRLTASPGTWNRMTETEFTYRWTRNGKTIAGATGSTYTTKAADLGASVAVQVTAKSADGSLKAGTATTAAKVVKGTAKVKVSASGAKKSATVKVTLTLQGRSAKQSAGVVRIYDGAKLKRTVSVRAGSTTVKVTGLKKGKHTLTAKFAGTGSHAPASAKTTVKVK